MSDHSPAANDPALERNVQMQHLADMRMEPLITRITSPPSRDLESTSDFGLHFGSEQPLTPGGPSRRFGQLLLVADDLSDLFSFADPFPEIGESMTAGVFEATQQEQQSCFGMSAYHLFHVSFASEPDLEILSEIHARASAPNHLACCTMHRLEDFDSHLEVGRFHYGQAFGAENGAVILKATNQDSGELVGCAWLQLHNFHKKEKSIPFCQSVYPLPYCVEQQLYKWVHRQIHKHRLTALRKSGTRRYGTLHYCK